MSKFLKDLRELKKDIEFLNKKRQLEEEQAKKKRQLEEEQEKKTF